MDTRYASLIVLLLAAALVPTALHSYADSRIDDGRRVSALPMKLGGMDGRPTERGVAWAHREFASDDAIERRYAQGLTLLGVRSYDAKRLYHHPELAAAWGRAFTAATVVKQEDLFIHRVAAAGYVALYVLRHRDESIESPLRFELRRATAGLVRPRVPVTLLFVHGPQEAEGLARVLLTTAVQSFDDLRARP